MATIHGHAIKVVVKRTGLSPHVIRMWEKRYAAVTPQRTETNRRLYSDDDIKRLSLLRQATMAGHSIGNIANLSSDRLMQLIAEDNGHVAPLPAMSRPSPASPEQHSHLEDCIVAIERLDAANLESALLRARVELSQPDFIEQVITPLMVDIGERWRDGSLRIMHEHLATAVVRSILGGFQEAMFDTPSSAPAIVVTTPVGQMHEIGALMVAATAASEGWAVTYLGANLPAEDIAVAAQQTQARAVALSLVHPADDSRIAHEITKLCRYLDPDVCLMIGGRAAATYREALSTPRIVEVSDLPDLRAHLERLR